MQRCLNALAAKFNDADVKIDETVFNAGRVVKAYGSKVRKGDDIPERPHRRSGLFPQQPDPVEVVSRELLEALAALAPPP